VVPGPRRQFREPVVRPVVGELGQHVGQVDQAVIPAVRGGQAETRQNDQSRVDTADQV
jgi:hypothetical protein